MSASREKKQRQGAGPSEKAVQVSKEQAASKRKARSYTIVGIVVVVLVALLLVWNSGLFQSRATAATVNDEKISVAEMSYYYYDARYIYAYYGLLDTTKPDAEQMYNEEEGTTYRDFFLESALKSAESVKVLYNAALEAGCSVKDIQENLDAQIESMKSSAANNSYSYKAFLKAIYGPYMTPSIYKEVVSQALLGSYYANLISDETEASFTDEDILAYYNEHADDIDEFEYSFLQFKAETVKTTDEDGNKLSEEEIAALEEEAEADAKAKAEATLASYNEGISIEELIEAGEPSSSGNHTTVQGTGSISSYYSEQLLELAADNATDKAVLVETESNGYYVVIFHSRSRNEKLDEANVRHILFKADAITDDAGKLVAPSEETLAQLKAEAEAVLAEYEAGEHTAEAFAALAEKYSDDVGSNTNGGLYEGVTEGSNFVTEFNNWLFGDDQPEVGETGLFLHEGSAGSTSGYWGYHIAYLESWTGTTSWEADATSALLSEKMNAWNEELASGYESALADGAKHLGN